jgi:large subunit ribosomal protein L10
MKKKDKPVFVAKLAQTLQSAKTLVLVDYKGLGVKPQQELKRRLVAVNATMIVAKNTLFARAAQEAKLPAEISDVKVLSGQTAYVMTEGDPIAPIAVLAKFAREFEVPNFKVAVVEGVFQDTNALITLSKLPSREILLGQVVGSIASPLYGLVSVTQTNIQKLLYILKSKGGDN